MRKVKTYAMSAVTLGGLFLIGSVMRSRDSQAKGAYSTPVMVMNTNSQPGSVLDAERATRIPYESASVQGGAGLQWYTFAGFTKAPAGYRLVVENVSGGFYLTPGSAAPTGFLTSDQNSLIMWGLPGASLSGPLFNQVFSGLNQNVIAYFDAGEGPVVKINANLEALFGFSGQVVLTGHLENCATTGCPPVQH